MACLLRWLPFRRAIRIKKKTWDLKETVNLIKEAVLANWDEKHKGKKEDGKMGIGSSFSLFLMALIHPLPRPLSFDTTVVRRLNLNQKQYMMVLQKKGNTLENKKKIEEQSKKR